MPRSPRRGRRSCPCRCRLQPLIGVWFVNMTNRAEQLTNWLKNGRPMSFWLTGFFNPSGFLTASRQEVCRAHSKDGWALDDCVNTFEVLKQEKDDVKAGPSEGIYVWGLSLDGARWDKARNALTDSEPKVRFAGLPVLHISATGEKRKGGKEILYNCPVYTCAARAAHGTQLRNYISNVPNFARRSQRASGPCEPCAYLQRPTSELCLSDDVCVRQVPVCVFGLSSMHCARSALSRMNGSRNDCFSLIENAHKLKIHAHVHVHVHVHVDFTATFASLEIRHVRGHCRNLEIRPHHAYADHGMPRHRGCSGRNYTRDATRSSPAGETHSHG